MESQLFDVAAGIIVNGARKRRRIILETLAPLLDEFDEEETIHALTRQIPSVLLCDVASDGEFKYKDFLKYLIAVDAFNAEQSMLCRRLLSGIKVGLKHHSLDCISFTNAFPSLIGMSKEQFFLLLMNLSEPLQLAFPGSPLVKSDMESTSSSSPVPPLCEIRMKLFLVLYRLKHAVSFNCLEAQFGWSSSSIHSWWKIIIKLLHSQLYPFHRGFLQFKGAEWQLQEVNNWKLYHEQFMEDYVSFTDRIDVQNNVCTIPRIDREDFIGSIGAVDGTYSVVCRFEEAHCDLDENGESLDRMYTNYKKCHAYKLVLVTSHNDKYIIALEIAPGSASDAIVFNTMLYQFLSTNMIKEAALLGDHAFSSCFMIITPYPTVADTSAHRLTTTAREKFNYNHSKDRMASEHGNCQLKSWAIVRGRTDHVMFENEESFTTVVDVCWGLHNWIISLKQKVNAASSEN